MAWITKEQVKEIRNALKEKFPEIKFSVRKEHQGSTVYVSILKSPYDFSYLNIWHKGRTPINRYHIPEGPHNNLLEDILEIVLFGSSRKYYNNSDAQIDHFDCAFYVNMGIGDWGKSYEKISMEEAKKQIRKRVAKKFSKKKTEAQGKV